MRKHKETLGVADKTQAHAKNKTAVAMSDATVMFNIFNCEDEATATTSKGDPPPDPVLESWLLGARVVLARAVEDGATFVACADVVNVSSDGLEPERLDDCASSVPGGDDADATPLGRTDSADDVVVVAPALLRGGTDTFVVVVLVVLELCDVTVPAGHSALNPRPFWKTPMMEVSPTSTPAQL